MRFLLNLNEWKIDLNFGYWTVLMRKYIIGLVRAEVLRSFVRLHCADGTQLTHPPSVLLLQRQSRVRESRATLRCFLFIYFFFFYKALSVTFSKWLQDCVFLLLLMGFLRTGVWKNTEGSQTTKWTSMLTHIRSFGDGVLCSDFSLSNDGRGFFFSSPPPACCERLFHFQTFSILLRGWKVTLTLF